MAHLVEVVAEGRETNDVQGKPLRGSAMSVLRLPLSTAASDSAEAISTDRSVMTCENCLRSFGVRNIGEHNRRCFAL